MTLRRSVDPLIINGAEFQPFLGQEIQQIRVFAFREGEMMVIPFQIDQRDSSGDWVWHISAKAPRGIEELDEPFARSRELLEAAAADDEDPPGTPLFDNNDVLVFLARDMGDRNEAAAEALGTSLVAEIKVVDPVDGASAWAYLASYADDPPPLSDVRYMQHDYTEKQVRTPVYRFRYVETNVACVEDLLVDDVPMLDRINIRGQVNVQLGIFNKSIRFTENDIHGYIEGVIEGPVRIIKRNIAHLDLYLVLTTPDVVCEHYYYPDFAEVPLCLPVGYPVKQASVFLLAELHESPIQHTLIGGSDKLVTVHGNEIDDRPGSHRLPIEWIAFDNGHGSMVSFLELPEVIAAHADAGPCLCGDAAGHVEAEISAMRGLVAGFSVKSREDTPAGPHVLHGTYVFSRELFNMGDEVAAYNMAHRKLGFQVVPPEDGH